MEEENRALEEDKNEPEDGKMKAKEEEVESGRKRFGRKTQKHNWLGNNVMVTAVEKVGQKSEEKE